MSEHCTHRCSRRLRVPTLNSRDNIEMRGNIFNDDPRIHSVQPEIPEPARSIVKLRHLLLDLPILSRRRQ